MSRPRNPARTLFEGLEGFLLLAAAVVSWPVSRRFLDNLGALPGEREREWPGDRLLSRVDRCVTRAVAVEAPASEVWPWLVQLGLDRGGFYSYELLERLGGIDVRNVERILPELQAIELGQEIKLHPMAPGLYVARLEPTRHLCLRTWKDERDLAARDPALVASWSLYLVAAAADSCRLLLRTCKERRRPPSPLARWAASFLEDPLDLVMEARMLRTIRRLAERRAGLDLDG